MTAIIRLVAASMIERWRRSAIATQTRRFARQQSGAAAVEFAMVVTPFLALTFAIMQTAMIFFAGQTLETATADGARLIMTGQAQTQGFSQDQFRQAVCNKIYGMFSCNGSLLVDVKSYSAFANVDTSKPINNGTLNTNVTYAPGQPGDIVVVRVMYQWPVYVSLLSLDLSDAGTNRVLMSTIAFRNEPYK